jgi:hypothetical protein
MDWPLRFKSWCRRRVLSGLAPKLWTLSTTKGILFRTTPRRQTFRVTPRDQTLLKDIRDGLSFVSDADQRHTVNAYGNYRITDTWNLSSEWCYGSGQPIPGFFRQVGAVYFLSNQRNTTRLPYYNRVDVRVSKAFLFKKWKLTLTGEVLNLLNRSNVRYAGFDGYGSNGRGVWAT